MTGPDEIDWATVDRYVAGECRPEEAAQVRRWLLAHAGLREFIERVPAAVGGPISQTPAADAWDTERALARLTQRPSRVARQWPRRSLVTGISMAAVGVLAVVFVMGVIGPLHHAEERVYATVAGQRLAVTLTDGTRFILAPKSQLRVPLTYGRDTRDVRLEGEAYFTVVHDAARPFAVHTRAVITRDVGTAFDVQAYPEDSVTRVAVTEGSVAVASISQPAGRGAIMRGGDVATIDSGGVTMTPDVSVAQLTAWTTGQLMFDHTPVSEVARTLSRWYDMDVIVASPVLQHEHLTATYTRVPANEVLQVVARALGARLVQHGRTAVLE